MHKDLVTQYVSKLLAFHFKSETKVFMFRWGNYWTLRVSLQAANSALDLPRPQHTTDQIRNLSPAEFMEAHSAKKTDHALGQIKVQMPKQCDNPSLIFLWVCVWGGRGLRCNVQRDLSEKQTRVRRQARGMLGYAGRVLQEQNDLRRLGKGLSSSDGNALFSH